MIKFPIINIAVENWNDLEDANCLFAEFTYTDNNKLFNKFFHNQEFVDCTGKTFKIIGKELPKSSWRHVFKFLPNVFKVKLIFEKRDKVFELNEFKRLIATGIAQYEENELTFNWLKRVKENNSIESILNLEVK